MEKVKHYSAVKWINRRFLRTGALNQICPRVVIITYINPNGDITNCSHPNLLTLFSYPQTRPILRSAVVNGNSRSEIATSDTASASTTHKTNRVIIDEDNNIIGTIETPPSEISPDDICDNNPISELFKTSDKINSTFS